MNLQHLQTDLCALIKSRPVAYKDDEYISSIDSSKHLVLIKRIALWWRRIQIENSCRLTAALLKSKNEFEAALSNFFKDARYSAFRDEVYIQFLQYIISRNTDALTLCVAEFELSLIQLKLNQHVHKTLTWNYEPYQIIGDLLKNVFTEDALIQGNFLIEISTNNKELFTVTKLNT
jgi:hypothetical protein